MSTLSEMTIFRDMWAEKMQVVNAYMVGFVQSCAPDAACEIQAFEAVRLVADVMDDHLRELNVQVSDLEDAAGRENPLRDHGTHRTVSGLRAAGGVL